MTFDELVENEVERQLTLLIPIIEQKIVEKLQGRVTNTYPKLVNQKDAARILGVSVSTMYKYRQMGLQSEPSPTRNLLFDIDKVRAWQAENDPRKTK